MEKAFASKESILLRRFGAFIVDHVILCVLSMVIFFVNFNKIIEDPMYMFDLFTVSMAIAILGYLFKDLFGGGRSLGKILFGVYVRDYENIEEGPMFYKLILRNLLIFIWPVELILTLIDKENRRLGDKIAKTQVVAYPENVIGRVVAVGVLGFVLFFASIFFGTVYIIKESASYKTAVEYIEKQEEILMITGEINGYGYFPVGSVSTTNGNGLAHFSIEVKGEKKNLTVNVSMEKSTGSEWRVTNMEYDSDQ